MMRGSLFLFSLALFTILKTDTPHMTHTHTHTQGDEKEEERERAINQFLRGPAWSLNGAGVGTTDKHFLLH